MDIITKIRESGLTGRSGSCFETALKWELVKKEKAEKKYAICNASEGEPGVFKDKYILENYPDVLIDGIKTAIETLNIDSAYIYLNKDYYPFFKKSFKNLPIFLHKKPEGYIAGEETSAIESIEGKRAEPRVKPPFPTQKGLFGCPTLIHNVETFYYISRIKEGSYDKKRFYCITGDVKGGVYELPENWSVEKVLKSTKNWPKFDFFLQVGGGACGEIILKEEAKKPIRGLASIIVFNKEKTDPFVLMKKWVDFFLNGNCDKCTPCREGLFRLEEIIRRGESADEIFFAMENTSLCPLGRNAVKPFKSLIKKIIND